MELAVAMHEAKVDNILGCDYIWNQFFYPKISGNKKEQQLIRAKNGYYFIHKDFQNYFIIKNIIRKRNKSY